MLSSWRPWQQSGLDLSIDEQALWIKAPSRVIQIILTNLLRNAINYTQQGSVIVRIRKNTISVIDTGIGMSPEELQHASSLLPAYGWGCPSCDGWYISLIG